ncbi:histidine kinase, partial [Actinomadura sp. DSM 109109]|nr:histidine kinase [Actinomadura lepetitiana]
APALVAVPPPAADPLPVRQAGGSTPEPEPEDPTPAEQDDPADGARPDPIEPEELPPVPDISTTPSGLPVRVPQANLAEPLRTEEPVVADEPDEQEDQGRSPEEIQRIMGSYQRGTQRGRVDAAEALGTNASEGEADQ